MLGASADNWAEIDQIEFYDVDDTAANAKPKATFTGQELKQNYVTNGILTIKREDIFKQSNETAESWQIGRVVIWLSDMDDQMTEYRSAAMVRRQRWTSVCTAALSDIPMCMSRIWN